MAKLSQMSVMEGYKALPTFRKLSAREGCSLLDKTSCGGGGAARYPLNVNILFFSGFDAGSRNISTGFSHDDNNGAGVPPRSRLRLLAPRNKSASCSHSSGPIYGLKDRRIKARLEFIGGWRRSMKILC